MTDIEKLRLKIKKKYPALWYSSPTHHEYSVRNFMTPLGGSEPLSPVEEAEYEQLNELQNNAPKEYNQLCNKLIILEMKEVK